MANTDSAKKRVRQNEKREERNRLFRVTARTHVKRVRRLIAEKRFDEAENAYRLAERALDKAARKGIVHPNNASRRKSRLRKALVEARQDATA